MFAAAFVLVTAALVLALDIADRQAAQRPDRARFQVVAGGGRGFGLEGF
jgi:hypothetical protein